MVSPTLRAPSPNRSNSRTLNRCLDNAIADAVLEFSAQRESLMLERHDDETRERVGFLVHELRNAVSTATLAVGALEFGNMNMGGAPLRMG